MLDKIAGTPQSRARNPDLAEMCPSYQRVSYVIGYRISKNACGAQAKVGVPRRFWSPLEGKEEEYQAENADLTSLCARLRHSCTISLISPWSLMSNLLEMYKVMRQVCRIRPLETPGGFEKGTSCD